jgi:hypothetical protein
MKSKALMPFIDGNRTLCEGRGSWSPGPCRTVWLCHLRRILHVVSKTAIRATVLDTSLKLDSQCCGAVEWLCINMAMGGSLT